MREAGWKQSLEDLEWLEQSHDEAAVAWAARMTRRSIERLRASPVYPTLRHELEQELRTAPPQPGIVLLGRRALRFLVNEQHPFGQLQVAERGADGAPGPWRTKLDIATLRATSGIPYELNTWRLRDVCLPPDHNRCLLRFSFGGGDETEIREFDLETEQFVEGGFLVPRSLANIQWLNEDLVLVGHTATRGAARTSGGWPASFRLWRRGQPLEAAEVAYEAKATDVLVTLDAGGIGRSRYAVIARTVDYSTHEVHLVYQDGAVEQAPFPGDAIRSEIMKPAVGAGAEAVFVQLVRDARILGIDFASNTILAYATDRSRPPQERIKGVHALKDDEFLGGPLFDGSLVPVQDQLTFVINRGLVPQVMQARLLDGRWHADQLLHAEPGQAISGIAGDRQSDDVIVTLSGFTTPSRQVLYREGHEPRLLAEDPMRFDSSGYITEIGTAISRDGTSIDYFLLRPRATRWTGPQPLLMTGYAAYGMSFPLSYFGDHIGGPALKLWLHRGGSLVIPAARGGSERGEAWYRAAIREKRQKSYDDFIAVLEQLIASGYSTPRRIGVFGESNGGLLAAVLGTQRPDLFGAVVSDVPLTDLIRMKFMGRGASWLGEYGDAADPAMAPILEAYSPLQNVEPGATYPPFFISTSTEDDRVGPGHARKLAARLEAAGSVVYFYEDREGGHGVSEAYRHPELMALRMTFLIDALMKDVH